MWIATCDTVCSRMCVFDLLIIWQDDTPRCAVVVPDSAPNSDRLFVLEHEPPKTCISRGGVSMRPLDDVIAGLEPYTRLGWCQLRDKPRRLLSICHWDGLFKELEHARYFSTQWMDTLTQRICCREYSCFRCCRSWRCCGGRCRKQVPTNRWLCTQVVPLVYKRLSRLDPNVHSEEFTQSAINGDSSLFEPLVHFIARRK